MTTTSTLQEVAKQYHGFGFNVLTLGKYKKDGTVDKKAPNGNRWAQWYEQRQADTTSQVFGSATGVALVSGISNLRCLDFDGFKNEDGTKNEVPFEVVEDVCRGLGIDCNSYEWIVQTGTGWHVWLLCSEELPKDFFNKPSAVNKVELEPSKAYEARFGQIELRWAKHYTVAPPSEHATGKLYTFKNCTLPSAPPASIGADKVLEALEPVVTFKEKEGSNSGTEFRKQPKPRHSSELAGVRAHWTVERAKSALQAIPPQQEHITWKKTVAALVDAIGEEKAIPLLEAWSPIPPGEAQYEYIVKNKLENVTSATLSFLARSYGWKEEGGALLAEDFQYFLLESFELRYNEILRRVEYRQHGSESWSVATERQFRQWKVTFTKKARKRISYEDAYDFATDNEVCPSHDPIRGYFDSLPTWDGEDHIRAFAECVQLSDESTRETFVLHLRKWFCGAYACGYYGARYGNRNELFLIFTGEQGKFKTTFFRHLVPVQLHDYKLESLNEENAKDAYSALSRAFIYIDEELSFLSKKETVKLKKLTSAEVFEYRDPYGKYEEKYERRVSFCGSTNEAEFLRDETGSRRFLVHRIEGVNEKQLKAFDIAKVWSQAKALKDDGFPHWLNEDEIREVQALNVDFSKSDYDEDLLLRFFRPAKKHEAGEWLQTSEVAERLARLHDDANTNSGASSYNNAIQYVRNGVPRIKVDNRLIQRLGALLASNKFSSQNKKLNGSTRKRWHVVEIRGIEKEETQEEVPF
jgi:hypothetical protein